MLRIAKIIQNENTNQTKLAEQTNIRRQRLTKCIHKKLDFTIDELEKINKVFNNKYDIEEFLIDDE